MTLNTQRKVIDLQQSMLSSTINSISSTSDNTVQSVYTNCCAHNSDCSSMHSTASALYYLSSNTKKSTSVQQQQQLIHYLLLWSFVLGSKCLASQPWNSPLIATICCHMDWALFCLLSVSIIIRTLKISSRLFVTAVLFHFLLDVILWSMLHSNFSSTTTTYNSNNNASSSFNLSETIDRKSRWRYNMANGVIYLYFLLWLHRPLINIILGRDYHTGHGRSGKLNRWWFTSLSGLLVITIHHWISQYYYVPSRLVVTGFYSMLNTALIENLEQLLSVHVIGHGVYLLLSKNMDIFIYLRHQQLIRREDKKAKNGLHIASMFSVSDRDTRRSAHEDLKAVSSSESFCILIRKETNHNNKYNQRHPLPLLKKQINSNSLLSFNEEQPWAIPAYSTSSHSRDDKGHDSQSLPSIAAAGSINRQQQQQLVGHAYTSSNARLPTSPLLPHHPMYARVEVLDSFDLCVVGLSAYTATFTWLFPSSMISALDAKPWQQENAPMK
ncbi:hypothetical protein BDF19DRAFT_412067 [Syncephalis fuscata]|nr:hypothetical protein BDF19DRAFT_412067 [Syncephalis fuscata]